MQVEKGGELYSFCPGKSTWDSEAIAVYQALVCCAETGIMLEEGSLSDQPDWWVELIAWFLPYYSDLKFYSRAKAILGDSKPQAEKLRKGNANGSNRR